MGDFTHYNGDPLFAAAAAILEGKQIETTSELEEGVEEIKAKVKDLKVGDKTNFGVIVAIGSDNITFKAKDLPKTKISFNQRKMGSRDFVLDAILKLKESDETIVGIELTEADDPDYSAATNTLYRAMQAAQKKKNMLFKQNQKKDSHTDAERAEYKKALDDWHNLQSKLQKSMEADDKAKRTKKEDITLDDAPKLDEEFIKKMNEKVNKKYSEDADTLAEADAYSVVKEIEKQLKEVMGHFKNFHDGHEEDALDEITETLSYCTTLAKKAQKLL